MATVNILLPDKASATLASLKDEGRGFSDVILEKLGCAPPRNAGELVDYLAKHCAGVPLMTTKRRAALRAGRGRRSNRRR